ncbi:hypothetical protein [Yersinia pseudotuberculosis]|uniref:hypothetical protein n=1 Tax=Yersinia pseudotuberculosis TaxID=633 RepID=UPI001F1DA872|nr:hypothetical protein [Yersinia pseudotuberculosis]MCF1165453.1 hypothetical protein [Yersinia pseudotuberculosis]
METKPDKKIKFIEIDDGHFEFPSLRPITIEQVKEELLCTKIKLSYMNNMLKTMLKEKEEYILPKHYISIIEVIEKLSNDSLSDVTWLCNCKIKNTDISPLVCDIKNKDEPHT